MVIEANRPMVAGETASAIEPNQRSQYLHGVSLS
jgi:hypothetical protein